MQRTTTIHSRQFRLILGALHPLRREALTAERTSVHEKIEAGSRFRGPIPRNEVALSRRLDQLDDALETWRPV